MTIQQLVKSILILMILFVKRISSYFIAEANYCLFFYFYIYIDFYRNMLNYASLASKPEMSRTIDGKKVSYKDLLCHTLNDEESVFEGIEFIRVIDDYVARPDLISLAVYGTDQYADILCKINGISNPFELNEGMILLIPNLSTITFFYKSRSASATFESDSTPISSTKKNFQKTKAERRRPSEQTVGSKNFVVDLSNKMIIY